MLKILYDDDLLPQKSILIQKSPSPYIKTFTWICPKNVLEGGLREATEET